MTDTRNSNHYNDGMPLRARPPREGREDGNPLCPSCSKPYTYDPKRYPGGFFCENAGCPAYQGIPDVAKECAFCSGDDSKPFQDHCTCPAHGATKEEESCPCDFHTKDLTEEQARIALFKPIVGGEEASPLVLIERFHHLWDARSHSEKVGEANARKCSCQENKVK